MRNVMNIMSEMASAENTTLENIAHRFHAAHNCNWETFRRTVAHSLATLIIKRVPDKSEVDAVEYTHTSSELADGIENAIIGGMLPVF